MRAGYAMLTLCTLITGCQQEPDFDERYDEHSREIEKQARSIEETVDKRLKAAEEAEAALNETALNETGDIEPSGGNPEQ